MNGAKPRVVVGVSTSVAGLAALRFAVAEAARREVPLYAVRAWFLHPTFDGPEGQWWREKLAAEATSTVWAAFDAALGGVPEERPVTIIAAPGHVDRALLRFAARPDDLLVLGGRAGSRRMSWIVRSCLRQANCPVTTVPPPELARTADRFFSVRTLIRDIERYTTPST